MKKFIGLVIILAALVLGSYYGMGYFTEKKVKEDLNMVDQSNGLEVKIAKYNRGWFKSKVVLDWVLHVPEHLATTAEGQTKTIPAEDYLINMPITIYHGPIIFAHNKIKFGFGFAHTSLALPEKLVNQFKTNFTNESIQPKLDLSLFINYLRTTSFDLSLPAFKLISKTANGGQLEWLGMSSETNVSADRNKISGAITIEGLRFTKDQTKTVMSTVRSKYNLHREPKNNTPLENLYLGDASLSFPSLEVTVNDQKQFELHQFDLHSDSNIKEGLFNSQFKTSLDKIVFNNKTYGPGHLDVMIRNLQALALTRINQQVNQLQQGNEQQRREAMLAIISELPLLLSQGAEFEISELSFTVPEGTIEANLKLSLPKSESTNPFELIQKLQGKGKLKIPATVLKKILVQSNQQRLSAQQSQNIQQEIVQQMQQQQAQPVTKAISSPKPVTTTTAVPTEDVATLADKQLATMVQSGFLTVQGNDYLIDLSFGKGQLLVNGKPFNQGMLKFQ